MRGGEVTRDPLVELKAATQRSLYCDPSDRFKEGIPQDP